ncbi:MAG: DinB family protein [Bacillota bacterium]
MAGQLRAALEPLRGSEYGFKPADNQWSVREIVAHLADVEEAIFAPRFEATLLEAATVRPASPSKPVNPERAEFIGCSTWRLRTCGESMDG